MLKWGVLGVTSLRVEMNICLVKTCLLFKFFYVQIH